MFVMKYVIFILISTFVVTNITASKGGCRPQKCKSSWGAWSKCHDKGKFSLQTRKMLILKRSKCGGSCPRITKEVRSCRLLIQAYRGAKGRKGFTVGSCRELKDLSFESGLYRIKLPSGKFTVYCEMGINGGGYTFISRKMVSNLTTADINSLFTKRSDVLLRISRTRGTQPYTIIRSRGGLSVQVNTHVDNEAPVNGHLGRYIFLSTYPASVAKTQKYLGFISNGKDLTYSNCGLAGRNYFAFFSNPDEKQYSHYHNSNLLYERSGLAVNWRKSALRMPSGSRMPLNFFLFTEMHYGGCGCYTSSDRWLNAVSPALGTAIGLR